MDVGRDLRGIFAPFTQTATADSEDTQSTWGQKTAQPPAGAGGRILWVHQSPTGQQENESISRIVVLR